MTHGTFNEVVDAIRQAKSAVVASHTFPDGDALGSMLAAAQFARALGVPTVVPVADDPVPKMFDWLPGADAIVHPKKLDDSFDTLVIVDVAQRTRIGTIADRIGPRVKTVIVDHHLVDTPDAHAFYVDPSYSSTGEIVADLFQEAGLPLDRDSAVNIYVALVTDTGAFRFSNTNARSHRIAARLLETGIDVARVSERVFDTMSPSKVQLLRRVLDNMTLKTDKGYAYTTISKKDMAETGAKHEDIEGLVNFARNIEGVRAGLLFRELDSGETKISVRSKDGFSAAKFLHQFGGGGHAGAAGATVQDEFRGVVDRVIARLEEVLSQS